jgi:hypothetical protein
MKPYLIYCSYLLQYYFILQKNIGNKILFDVNETYFVLFDFLKTSVMSGDQDDSCKKNGFLGTCSAHEMMTELNA